MENTIWIILGVVSAVLWVIYFRSQNAVWGGLTAGIIIGLIIAVFSNFNWYIVGKGIIAGTIIGFGAELLGKVLDKMKKNRNSHD